MSKFGKISGFPEWLPDQKLIENRVFESIRAIYEQYGYTPIETAAVEPLAVLSAKGVIDKEIYALKRARDTEGGGGGEAELGLHFDLSVPLARYVAQNFGNLTFPFKRYQCQKVWRGDRPQKGRFREFYQFDIDVIAQDDLPLSCDAEILSAYTAALAATGAGKFTVKLNNRKILIGFFESLGLSPEQQNSARIIVDKILKIRASGVKAELETGMGLDSKTADKIVQFAEQSFKPGDAKAKLESLGVSNPTFETGVAELLELLKLADTKILPQLLIDLSLARGLDYYTGAVFEAYLDDHSEFGSVGSGGRYDNLTSQFINKKLPGVGVSIGVTRLMDLILSENLIPATRKTVTKALITVLSEEQRPLCNQTAGKLRSLGVPTEVYFKSPKIGKQIEYAEKKGITCVLFIQPDGAVEAKDLKTKEQRPVTDFAALAQQLKD